MVDNSNDQILKTLWKEFYEVVENLCNRYNYLLRDQMDGDTIAIMHPLTIVDLAQMSVELEWRDRKYIENIERKGK